MPAIILSDNGVSSGSAGLKTSGSNDGILTFQTTTAGGTATTAVTINTAQNVGVGITSPVERLTVANTGTSDIVSAYRTQNSTGNLSGLTFALNNSSSSKINYAAIYARISSATAGSESGELIFYNYGSGTNAERMRLDASGNLGVGTTSPLSKLVVSNGSSENVEFGSGNVSLNGGFIQYINRTTAATRPDMNYYLSSGGGAHKFYTNDLERARITAAGVLLVGVTATGGGGSHLIQAGAGVNALQCQNNSTTPYGPYFNFSAAAPNNGTFYFLACADTSTTRCVIYSNGGIANYQANNSNLSDRREKTNFAPAGNYLAKICAIPVQTFNYIDQNTEEDGGLTLGVVAQDVQAVAPELVTETNWADKDKEPKMRLSIYQTDLQYALMKSIQELKAEFDAYKLTHP